MRALFLTCLACTCQGHQVQSSASEQQPTAIDDVDSRSQATIQVSAKGNPTEFDSLARLLMALNPALAYTPAGSHAQTFHAASLHRPTRHCTFLRSDSCAEVSDCQVSTPSSIKVFRLDDDCSVTFVHNYLPPEEAEQLLGDLPGVVEPQLESVGTRRVATYFDQVGVRYRFHARNWFMENDQEMPTSIRKAKEAVSAFAGVDFNGAVCNVYDTMDASIKWHDDGEPTVGPIVASLSLGRSALMGFRRKPKRRGHPQNEGPITFEVHHNTLVIMSAGVQRGWQHRIFKPDWQCPLCWMKMPATKRTRINLTFHQHRPHDFQPLADSKACD